MQFFLDWKCLTEIYEWNQLATKAAHKLAPATGGVKRPLQARHRGPQGDQEVGSSRPIIQGQLLRTKAAAKSGKATKTVAKGDKKKRMRKRKESN